MIAGRKFWLWRAVDDKGEVLDLPVQRWRDKAAAVKPDLASARFRVQSVQHERGVA